MARRALRQKQIVPRGGAAIRRTEMAARKIKQDSEKPEKKGRKKRIRAKEAMRARARG